ncbi:DUF998 domain-containing protein [Herbidospora cretacea]|uniref:DUF998 domain-containing protein n=1 Tax=Herbidospora cretacea TaxID=28444 RepID=UPI0009EDC10E|nr:DUF998 domain-containing protein [Herbidospora cretacea]
MTVTTRTLLLCAAVAGPLWSAVSLAQAATREGFDLTRHPLSLLSTGSPGWVQIANFVVAGLLMLAGAAGFRRVTDGAWLPRLVGVSGLGMIAAGVLVMEPGDGFPAGTPAGPGTLGVSGIGHMAAGSITFAALIAACYVLGRRFSRAGDRGSALASRVAGTALLAGNLWAMSGGKAGSLTLAVGAISAMLWISWVAWAAARGLSGSRPASTGSPRRRS